MIKRSGQTRLKGPSVRRLPDVERRLLVLKRTDGLGARLLAMLRTWRFARKLDVQLEMYWSGLNYSFRDAQADDGHLAALFDLEASDLRGLTFIEDRPPATPEGRVSLEHDPELRARVRNGMTADQVFARGSVVDCGGQAALKVPGETPSQIASEITALYEGLVFSAPIEAALTRARALIGPDPFAALHVRRGDVLAGAIAAVRGKSPDQRVSQLARSYIRRCPPVPIAVGAVQRGSPGQKVLVFGDTPAFVDHAKALLGHDNIINIEGASIDLGSLQRALFEISLMREAQTIYAGNSAFSRLPAEIGPARMEPVLPDVEGEADLWAHAFELEVLEPAGAAQEDRDRLLGLYRTEWELIKEYCLRSKEVRDRRRDIGSVTIRRTAEGDA